MTKRQAVRIMTKQRAARIFEMLLLSYGAELSPRDPAWLDFTEPKNVFTRASDQ